MVPLGTHTHLSHATRVGVGVGKERNKTERGQTFPESLTGLLAAPKCSKPTCKGKFRRGPDQALLLPLEAGTPATPRVPSPRHPWYLAGMQCTSIGFACVCLLRMRTISGLRHEPVLITGQANGQGVKVPGKSDPQPTGVGEMPLLPPDSTGQFFGVFCLVAQWGPRENGPLIRVPALPPPLCVLGPPPKPAVCTTDPRLRSVPREAKLSVNESPSYVLWSIVSICSRKIDKGVLCPFN